MFLAIGYGIPSTKSKEDVMSLFAVMAGEESIETAAKILNNKELVKYAAEHGQESWTPPQALETVVDKVTTPW